jgi:hypothetical protein
MTSRIDPRQAALAERLRLLTRLIMGTSAGLAVAFWALVAPAASTANAPVAASTDGTGSASTDATDGSLFRSSSSTSSLGGGIPVLRSHGS